MLLTFVSLNLKLVVKTDINLFYKTWTFNIDMLYDWSESLVYINVYIYM